MSRQNSKNQRALRWLCLILMFGFSLGMPSSHAWAEEGELVSTEDAALGVTGKKDPFKPFVETASEVARQKKTKGAVPISPLQRQDLAAFNLVGISGNDKEGWKAIVEDGEKKFYPVVEGTLIGLESGRVSSIKPDRMIVAISSSDQKGKTTYITIMLHKDVEETP